jgi:hypothetical protein
MTNPQSAAHKARHKQLVQIVIGSAWVDGQIGVQETAYLSQLLQRYGLANDPDLQRSLTTSIPIQQTEQWIREYLFGTTEAERQQALVAIAKLLIVDDTVTDTEHQLLDDYYTLMAEVPPLPDFAPMVRSVSKFVKQAAEAIGQLVNDLDKPQRGDERS